MNILPPIQLKCHYLDATLNVLKMYKMYKELYPTDKISYESYWRYFKEDFDLKFGRPQKDTCVACEELGKKSKAPL